jgi:putative aldouronate transport system permease protein
MRIELKDRNIVSFKIKNTGGERTFAVINTMLMLIIIFIMFYPFYYVSVASVSKPDALAIHTGILLRPLGFTLDAYTMTFRNPMIIIGYRNTLLYVALGVCISLSMTTLGAYVLSRRDFLLRRPLSLFCLFTMFFSGGIIPMYLKVNQLGLGNTMWALLLPACVNTFNMIVMRTSFSVLPAALDESARIDGANDFVILLRIVLPLSLPILAVILLFYAVEIWNSWFSAMLYLKDRQKYPLQLVLREILITSNQDVMMADVSQGERENIGELIKYASIMIASLPIMCIYPFLQKYFVKGMMIGAIKG